jgi:hypothetical protein
MKTRISTAMRSLWIVALLFVAQSAQAQAGFEGRIVQTMKIAALGDEPMEMIMNVKGDKLMMSMDVGPQGIVKMYPKSDGSSMVVVLEQMKMGIEMSMEDAAKLAQTASTTEAPTMTATGKKETINGYACEEWLMTTDANTTVSIWATNDIDKSLVTAMHTATKILNTQSPDAAKAAIAKELMDKGMIAARTVFMSGGEPQLTLDLVKIEKTPIADAMFDLPKDINIQKMDPNMMPQGTTQGD